MYIDLFKYREQYWRQSGPEKKTQKIKVEIGSYSIFSLVIIVQNNTISYEHLKEKQSLNFST